MMESVVKEDFRHPIPTGINGLDKVMNGGLAKGELAIILAALGVGKTTFITKIANSAKDAGYNVLQIFFEDSPQVIQRKHLACWSGYDLNKLNKHEEELIELLNKKEKESGTLTLKKFPIHGTNINDIEEYIIKLISQSCKPDILLLDSLHFLSPVINYGVSIANNHKVIQELGLKYGLAIWLTDIIRKVETNQIIKTEFGDFIVSFTRNSEQIINNTANMGILKSTCGESNLLFRDIEFDAITLKISLDNSKVTYLE